MSSSCAASVTAVGSPRATSAAKLGPERIAGTASGAHSAMISVMNFRVPCSMPLAQVTIGVPGADAAASALQTERIACAGTTSRIASARAASARSRVTAMRCSSFTPGRNRLSRFVASCSAFPASCSHSVTLRPARAVTLASAVPQAPPPSTAMRSNVMRPLHLRHPEVLGAQRRASKGDGPRQGNGPGRSSFEAPPRLRRSASAPSG